MKKHRFLLILLLSGAILQTGCSRPKMYINRSANLQSIKKVAVLPFNNMSSDKYAGEKMKNAFMMELLARDMFEVAEEGEVNKVIAQVFSEMGYREGDLISLDLELIQRIHEILGVQALFLGTVENYGPSRGGSSLYSVVSFSVILVDGSSGRTTWRGQYFAKGVSMFRDIFGQEQKSEIELGNDVVKRLLGTLFKS